MECRDPSLGDVESWDCACHDVMKEKCKLAIGEKDFEACYRTQLCNDPKVCSGWKEEVCTEKVACVDNDKKLEEILNQKGLTCAGVAADCRHEEIGRVVRLQCPQSCGMCNLYPYQRKHVAEVDLQLTDATPYGKRRRRRSWGNRRSWTLTPTPPVWTHTPTDDQSCFVNPDAFDCACYATKQRYCKKESLRMHLRHPSNKVYTATECEQFFVCTHSQTCKRYKDEHCKKEMALLKRLQAKKHMIPTC